MLIGATVNGNHLDAQVPAAYEAATHLIIVETDDDSISAIFEKQDDDGLFFAEKLHELDCEAVVCGTMQMPGFERVAGYCITRYFGVGLSVLDAIHGGLYNTLPNIVDYEGGTGCDSHEHEAGHCDGSCGAHDDEDDEDDACSGDCAHCSTPCQ